MRCRVSFFPAGAVAEWLNLRFFRFFFLNPFIRWQFSIYVRFITFQLITFKLVVNCTRFNGIMCEWFGNEKRADGRAQIYFYFFNFFLLELNSFYFVDFFSWFSVEVLVLPAYLLCWGIGVISVCRLNGF